MAEDKETVEINLRIPQLSHRGFTDDLTDSVREIGNGIIGIADRFAEKTKKLGQKLKKGFTITAGATRPNYDYLADTDADTDADTVDECVPRPPQTPPTTDRRKVKLDAYLRLIIALSALNTESSNALLQLIAVKAYKLVCPTAKVLIEGDCQKSLISCCKDVLDNEEDHEVAEEISSLLEMCTGAKVV